MSMEVTFRASTGLWDTGRAGLPVTTIGSAEVGDVKGPGLKAGQLIGLRYLASHETPRWLISRGGMGAHPFLV
jgi:hypothetical protein